MVKKLLLASAIIGIAGTSGAMNTGKSDAVEQSIQNNANTVDQHDHGMADRSSDHSMFAWMWKQFTRQQIERFDEVELEAMSHITTDQMIDNCDHEIRRAEAENDYSESIINTWAYASIFGLGIYWTRLAW